MTKCPICGYTFTRRRFPVVDIALLVRIAEHVTSQRHLKARRSA